MIKYAFYPGCVAKGGAPELYTSATSVAARLGLELTELTDVGIATFKMMLVNMLEGRFISEHDFEVSTRIATVLCGGEVEVHAHEIQCSGLGPCRDERTAREPGGLDARPWRWRGGRGSAAPAGAPPRRAASRRARPRSPAVPAGAAASSLPPRDRARARPERPRAQASAPRDGAAP